jgi:hypothetical protein
VEVADKIFSGVEKHLDQSRKSYDWLGNGVYFWESDLLRAKEWAVQKFPGNQSVVGAVIDLGFCLDMSMREYCDLVSQAHSTLKKNEPTTLKENRKPDAYGVTMYRELDCQVIEFLHGYQQEKEYPSFDTVRSPFIESGPLYDNSSFRSKTHIQIAVRNIDCILGYFRPLE